MEATIKQLKLDPNKPIIIADHHGTITYINDAFTQSFGWESNQLIKKSLTTIIPKNLRVAHDIGFSNFLQTEQPTLLNQSLELLILKKDGTEQNTTHWISAIKQTGQWIFGANIT